MIRGDGIALRTIREADLDFLYNAVSDVEVRGPWVQIRMSSQPGYRKRFQETGFFSPDEGQLAIVDAEDDSRIFGTIGWFRPVFYADSLEIGYQVLDVAQRGKGTATAALRLLCGYLFADRNIHRLQLAVVVGNEASRRVAEKVGFRSEGIQRDAAFLRGGYYDLEMFSLLRPEWKPVAPLLPVERT
jgi:ribosomal-protein-alanine N-acetyltransferase